MTAAGKIFLFGEYSVLAGNPAVVAAIRPRFALSLRAAGVSGGSPFHPESPAGRLLARASGPAEYDFEDPHNGRGGFGGSTAQFALVYRALAGREGWETDWQSVLRAYRDLAQGEALPPSGADLVAQWTGGLAVYDPVDYTLRDLSAGLPTSQLLVFSAAGLPGRKVATHEHLAQLAAQGFPGAHGELTERLGALTLAGIRALESRDLPALGQAMTDYAEALREGGLEIPQTTADRAALEWLPGVAGLKGAGALQADAIVILLNPSRDPAEARQQRTAVLDAARARGLALVADGIRLEPGVECHS